MPLQPLHLQLSAVPLSTHVRPCRRCHSLDICTLAYASQPVASRQPALSAAARDQPARKVARLPAIRSNMPYVGALTLGATLLLAAGTVAPMPPPTMGCYLASQCSGGLAAAVGLPADQCAVPTPAEARNCKTNSAHDFSGHLSGWHIRACEGCPEGPVPEERDFIFGVSMYMRVARSMDRNPAAGQSGMFGQWLQDHTQGTLGGGTPWNSIEGGLFTHDKVRPGPGLTPGGVTVFDSSALIHQVTALVTTRWGARSTRSTCPAARVTSVSLRAHICGKSLPPRGWCLGPACSARLFACGPVTVLILRQITATRTLAEDGASMSAA